MGCGTDRLTLDPQCQQWQSGPVNLPLTSLLPSILCLQEVAQVDFGDPGRAHNQLGSRTSLMAPPILAFLDPDAHMPRGLLAIPWGPCSPAEPPL